MTRHLMAKFRRRSAGADGLHFDWQAPDRWSSGSEAKLENGDWIMVKPHLGRWEYHLFGPPLDHDDPQVLGKPGYMFFSGYGEKPAMAAEILGRREWRDGLDTHEEAQRAAEQHYLSLNRTTQGRSSIDSGVDYDALLKPAPLNDDFGDIFGEGR